MDQDKFGLFSFLLQSTYEETKHIDVVKMKRDKILVKLSVLKSSFESREYQKANFILLDVCDKILNDPHADEYKLNHVQIDMLIFSSAVVNLSVNMFDRAQQVMTALIIKYGNPVFYYILALSQFYCLCFEEAKKQFTYVMHLVTEYKNIKLLWPETDTLMATMKVEDIKENALFFLNLIASFQDVKPIKKNPLGKDTQEAFEVLQTFYDPALNLHVGIGHYIQNDIYPHIRALLPSIMKFDKSKLPSYYRKIMAKMSREETKKQSEVLINQDKAKASTSPEESSTKKHQSVQVQGVTKCKQVQTVFKTNSQSIQTLENNTGLFEKNKLISEQHETILSLKSKISQLTQQHKDFEAKMNEKNTKNNATILDKNKLINEQQEIISNLKLKLKEAATKQKEAESRVNKMNNKVNELIRANKATIAESQKNRETIAELRKYNQLLEKKAKSIGKSYDDMKIVQKKLLDKFKDVYYVQIQFYENFHKRCENVLAVLDNIKGLLTEISVPTKEDCEVAIKEWLSALLSCGGTLTATRAYYKKYNKMMLEDGLVELLNAPPIVPIKEPQDALVESIPILVYTVKDFENMLQKNHRVKNGKTVIANHIVGESENDANGKTDYRKKCNFIHKPDQSSTSNENSISTNNAQNAVETPSEPRDRANSENENSDQKIIDISSKKLRKLILYLKTNIPQKPEIDIITALNAYRESNNGSLSGMTLQSILYNVLAILETPQSAWSAVRSDLQELENEDVCPICIEPLATKQKSTLTCRHVYHTECIREWLSRNRVCAVCRMYTVLDDDFPPLKN